MAPEVGIDLATPTNFVFMKASEFAAITATESLGVTKNYLPKIIFLSASPSQAAPIEGISAGILLDFYYFYLYKCIYLLFKINT